MELPIYPVEISEFFMKILTFANFEVQYCSHIKKNCQYTKEHVNTVLYICINIYRKCNIQNYDYITKQIFFHSCLFLCCRVFYSLAKCGTGLRTAVRVELAVSRSAGGEC